MKVVRCKYCRKEIFFAQTDKGHLHPFDAKKGMIATVEDGSPNVTLDWAHLSHFATCKEYKKK